MGRGKLLWAIVAWGLAAGALASPKWLAPSDEVVSEHIAWMKPAADGPMRALFITHEIAMREVVEVCERFDIEREVFAVWKPDTFASPSDYQHKHFPGISEKEVAARLREKLAKDYDLIVIGGIKWGTLPAWAREEIVAKVKAGTGLVAYLEEGAEEMLASAGAKDAQGPPILGGYPFRGLPAFRGYESEAAFEAATVKRAQAGEGRIVILQGYENSWRQAWTPRVIGSLNDFRMLHYDYYLALLGHAFRWAAKREGKAQVSGAAGSALRVGRGEFQGVTFAIECEKAGSVPAELRFALRDADGGEVVAEETRKGKMKAGRSEALFKTGPVPAGRYFADLWVAEKGKLADYASVFVEVTSGPRIEGVWVGGKALDGPEVVAVAQAEPVDVLVATAGMEEGGFGLRVRQYDNYGRLVAQWRHVFDPDWAQQKTQCKLRSAAPLSVAQRLVVELEREGETVDRRRGTFFYEDVERPIDNVRAMLFDGWLEDEQSYLCATLASEIKRAGFDMFNVHTRNVSSTKKDSLFPGRAAALENLELVVGTSGIGRIDRLVEGKRVRSALGPVRVPCLTNPDEGRSMEKGARQATEDWKPFSVKYFNLGDERALLAHGLDDDICFSDTCVADYREWMRGEYGSLDAVNAEYGTTWKTWEEVAPIELEAARKTGEFARWIDHRRHMESLWARNVTEARERIRKGIPFATTGTMGSNDPGHAPRRAALAGLDYWKLVRETNPNLNYLYPLQLDAARDFAGRDTLIGGGLWGGYHQLWRSGIDPVHHRWWVWQGVFRGANAITVYKGTGGTPLSCDTIAPDFSFFDWMGATLEEIKRVRKGPGALLLASVRANDGIAVLYSAASMDLTEFFGDFPQYWDCIHAMPTVLEQAGFQYRLVSEEEVKGGILASAPFRVLYLPQTLALSSKAADAIRAFVEGGGTAIADLRPAIADEHGKLREGGALDDIFGVRQDVKAARGKVAPIELMGFEGIENLGATHTDAALALAGGEAHGKAADAPAVIVNLCAKGLGVLLNLSFFDYMEELETNRSCFRSAKDEETVSRFMRQVLALAGVEPEVTVEPHLPGCSVTRFHSGDATYLGLLWAAPAFQPGPYHDDPADYGDLAQKKAAVTLRLGREAHVYDVLAGAYLGKLAEVRREVSPGEPHLLAALPSEVKGVSVGLSRKGFEAGGEVAFEGTVETEGAQAGRHVVRMEFFDPEGREVDLYARHLVADGGRFKGTLPLALDEKAGEWKIMARDIASGVSGEARFSVETGE